MAAGGAGEGGRVWVDVLVLRRRRGVTHSSSGRSGRSAGGGGPVRLVVDPARVRGDHPAMTEEKQNVLLLKILLLHFRSSFVTLFLKSNKASSSLFSLLSYSVFRCVFHYGHWPVKFRVSSEKGPLDGDE